MFAGESKDSACTTYSSHFGKKITIRDAIKLYPDRIWILVNIYGDQGVLLMGRQDGIPRKLKKCRFYSGWAAVPICETKAGGDRNKSGYAGIRNLCLHDQGQRTQLILADGTRAEYDISLAEVTYAVTQTTVLKLGIHEADAKATTCYIWAEPGAQRLGANLTWLQAGFTLQPDRRFAQ